MLGRGPKRRRERRYELAPFSKFITSQRFLILRQRCEATSSTPYRPDRALPSLHNQLHPPSHTYPTILLAYSRCHPASASASPSHFDRPSSAHDKQSFAAIKPPQGPPLSRALLLSHRVSFSDYGRARSGSRLFISGTIYSNCATYLCCICSSPSNSLCIAITDIHSRPKGTSHEMGRRPRRRI